MSKKSDKKIKKKSSIIKNLKQKNSKLKKRLRILKEKSLSGVSQIVTKKPKQ